MLLHATSKDNSNILDYCIKEIKNMGYEFKSLDEFEKQRSQLRNSMHLTIKDEVHPKL